MKTKITKLFALLLFSLTMTSCYRVSPDAGQESVLVDKPYVFGKGGVQDDAISTGSVFVWASTDHKEFVITPVTITEDFVNMIPSDNTPVSFNAYLKLQIRKGQTPILYKNFGEAWYANNLQATFRTMVRDKASAFKMFDLASKREISERLEQDIFKDISAYAKSINLPVDIMQVSIGAVTPPEQVLTETKLTSAQNQSILTQKARADAELARKQAEINKAIADQAYMSQMNMTIDQYLHMRTIEIDKEKVELIKDHPNVSIIFGSGAQPTFPIK